VFQYKLSFEEERLREKARERANFLWEAAEVGPHPYLDKKGVCSCGARVFDGKLVVPVTTIHGEMTSAQLIYPDGRKKFLRGGKTGGMMRLLVSSNSRMDILFICEGWATGATLHSSTGGGAILVTFQAANLSPVTREARLRFPKSHIIVCADNDKDKPSNVGLDMAFKAAKESDAVVIAPMGIKGTDFNDMQNELGIFYVARYIEEMLNGKAKAGKRNKRR
jgi:putative DNA primase/helicase